MEQDYTVNFTSNTPVASNESVYFELFTTHHKVKYAVDTGPTCNFGHAYKPNGTYIKKLYIKNKSYNSESHVKQTNLLFCGILYHCLTELTNK